jgi:dienelactone hydrolase
LNPVVARLLIYGVNPFDLERVLRKVESAPLRNARQLETRWLESWEELAQLWKRRFQAAVEQARLQSAREMGMNLCCCRLAQFLISPGEIQLRREIYERYAADYRYVAAQFQSPVQQVQVPLSSGARLEALLHLPKGPAPHACAVVLSGLGSCKEEMHTLARLMVERGLAALVPDMPGNGETLFRGNVTCGSENLSASFRAIAEFIESRPDLDGARFGALGLCMGGGYAYRACSEDVRYGWCATLFPLFINEVGAARTPAWMKSGAWYDLQTGGKTEAEIFRELGWHDEMSVRCPFIMAHSKHDNWMTLEQAQLLYDHANPADRELLLIDEEPVFVSGETTTHSMPVGEQLAWVGPVVADWVATRVERLATVRECT